MIERKSDQGSAEWLQERAGRVTASCFADVLAVSKRDGKPLKAREDYLMKLVAERLTGKPTESASSFSMAWGTDAEPYARTSYEVTTGRMVREVGFKCHADPAFEWVGASSDGLVGTDGGIEIKCPYSTAVHVRTIRDGMPDEHIPQVQGQMWVLGLSWIDFCSYDPRMPSELQLYIQRIERDDIYIKTLSTEISLFLAEIDSQVIQILKKAA